MTAAAAHTQKHTEAKKHRYMYTHAHHTEAKHIHMCAHECQAQTLVHLLSPSFLAWKQPGDHAAGAAIVWEPLEGDVNVKSWGWACRPLPRTQEPCSTSPSPPCWAWGKGGLWATGTWFLNWLPLKVIRESPGLLPGESAP